VDDSQSEEVFLSLIKAVLGNLLAAYDFQETEYWRRASMGAEATFASPCATMRIGYDRGQVYCEFGLKEPPSPYPNWFHFADLSGANEPEAAPLTLGFALEEYEKDPEGHVRNQLLRLRAILQGVGARWMRGELGDVVALRRKVLERNAQAAGSMPDAP
jgi:hypothetical protein